MVGVGEQQQLLDQRRSLTLREVRTARRGRKTGSRRAMGPRMAGRGVPAAPGRRGVPPAPLGPRQWAKTPHAPAALTPAAAQAAVSRVSMAMREEAAAAPPAVVGRFPKKGFNGKDVDAALVERLKAVEKECELWKEAPSLGAAKSTRVFASTRDAKMVGDDHESFVFRSENDKFRHTYWVSCDTVPSTYHI